MAIDLKPPVTMDELKSNYRDLKAAEDHLKKAVAGGMDVGTMLDDVKTKTRQVKKLRDGWYPGKPL